MPPICLSSYTTHAYLRTQGVTTTKSSEPLLVCSPANTLLAFTPICLSINLKIQVSIKRTTHLRHCAAAMAGMTAPTVLVAFLVATVAALPSTLLEDTKQAAMESEPIISRVKRAQEVILFGNQQNRPTTEKKFYPSSQKRAANKHVKDEEVPTALPIAVSTTSKTWETGSNSGHHVQHSNGGKATGRNNIHYPGGQRVQYHQELGNGDHHEAQGHGKTVSQYEKGYQYGVGKAALDKHVENALLKSELYGDPGAVNQYQYYGGSNERKRNQHLTYSPPSKRSYHPEMPFVFPPDDLTSSRARLKRDLDLDLDPEDVLTMLSLLEAERRATADSNQRLDPSWFSYYGQDTPESFRGDEGDEGGEDEEDSTQTDGGWLERPVSNPSTTPHRYQLDRHGGYYYPMLSTPQQYPLYPAQKRESGQWGGFAKDKRFMVSKKQQVSSPHDEVQALAQLLDHPYRDPGVPLYRRVIL